MFVSFFIRFCDSRNINHNVTFNYDVVEHVLAGCEFSNFMIF
jgi:hypothetical protein